jgi:serine protease AprX
MGTRVVSSGQTRREAGTQSQRSLRRPLGRRLSPADRSRMERDTDSEVALKMQPTTPHSAPTRGRIRWIALAVTVCFSALPVAAAPAAGRISDPALARAAAQHPARQVSVIAQFAPGVSRVRAERAVRSAGGRHLAVVPIINGITARMPARGARTLSRIRWVRAVSHNGVIRGQSNDVPDPRQLDTSFIQSLNLDKAWPRATGDGIGVAVIDTGIAGDLPDFQVSDKDTSSRVIATAVTNPGATTPADTYGHGTHVAGIIAGNSMWRDKHDKAHGRFAGTAPDADLISIKAADDQGNASVLDVIYGIEFAIEHKDDYNIRVLNLSVQSESAESYTTDPLDAAVEAAWFSGITVVTAVGNRGSAADAVNYAPGNDPYAISVGAVDDNGTKDINDDAVADWSSRGTTQDGFAKPDVYAPGAHILSTLAPDSAFASMCPTCIFDGEYIKAGGTSMAAPMISGIAADILQIHPGWTPDMVKGALTSTLRTVKAHKGDSADTVRPSEVDANHAIMLKDDAFAKGPKAIAANQGLTPNQAIVDPDSGTVDLSRSSWSRSRWSRSSWSAATGPLAAGWARSSWSCTCAQDDGTAVDPSRSSWSRSSWSTAVAF